MERDKISISVVICHHTGDLIYRCLDSIRKSQLVDYEIIVMADEYRDYGKDIQLISCKELPAQKRNYSINFCKGEHICFLDDDTELEPLTLYWLWNECQGVDMTYAKLLSMYDRTTLDHNGAYLGFGGFLVENTPLKTSYLWNKVYSPILAGKSACCMIKKSWFELIGGFDRDFGMFGEETDLSWRVWLMGGIVSMCEPAICYHAFNTPLKDPKIYYSLKTVHYHGCKNYPTMLIKNLSLYKLCLILPIHLCIWLMACLIMRLRGKKQESNYIWAGLGYLWTNRGLIWAKRRAIQQRRVIKDKELFKLIAQRGTPSYYINRFKEYIIQGREARLPKE